MKTCLVSLAVVVMATGCAAKKIPGTEIDDTDDTRAILSVMEAYRQGVEKRDAQTVYDLTDPSFKDDGGSADPGDDLDYVTLKTTLPDRLKRLEDVKLEISVRKVEIDNENQGARATYTYTATWKMPSLTQRSQSEGEIKQMSFKRVGDKQWKIVSGI